MRTGRGPATGARVPAWAERAVTVFAVAIWVSTLLRWGYLSQLLAQWPLVLAFGAVIAVGEYFRFTLEEGREIAPMSLAAAIGFTLTSFCGDIDIRVIPAAPILVVTGVAMVLGSLPHLARGRRVGVAEIASRFIGVAFTATLFRVVPFLEDGSLVRAEHIWATDRPLLAVVMTVVSAVGLMGFLGMSALASAARRRRDLGQSLVDEVRSGAGLSLALSTTGALVALAERPLGVIALPLFLVPLVLTQFALRQFAAIRATDAQTVRVLSRLTEVAGFTRPGHSDRVAALCNDVGHELGLSDRELRSLEYAALLHDVGQIALTAPIPGGATLMAAPADQRQIAADGAAIVRKTGVPGDVAEAVELQASPYRLVHEQGQAVPLVSRIVKVVNAYDDLVGGSIAPGRREAAVERIQLGLGYEHDPRVVAALERVLARQSTLAGPALREP